MQKIRKKMTRSRRNPDEQDFLLSITVYQAKNLPVQHLKSFVEVSFSGKVKTTRVAKSSSNPHFNEYLVFEVRCTLAKLLRKSVTFRLYHEACLRRCSGEVVMDLETVWNVDGRGFYGAWGRLVPCSGAINRDNTMRLPSDHQASQVLETDRQRVLLNFNLYRGVFPTIGDYCVHVDLCGVQMSSRTARMTEFPEWNQQFQFMWFFPALCGNFGLKIECPGALKSKSIWKGNLFLKNLSHDINGEVTLPTFGPAWWHLYKEERYLGRILFSIETTHEPERSPFSRAVKVNGINRFFENDFWTTSKFKIHLSITDLDFLHTSSREIRIEMSCGENSSSALDILCTNYKTSNLFLLDPSEKIPTLSMDLILPDLRHILRDEILIRNFISQCNIDLLEDEDSTRDALRALKEVLSKEDDGETLMLWHVYFRASIVASLEAMIGTTSGTFIEKLLGKLEKIANQGVTKWQDLFIKLLDSQGRIFGIHRVDLKDIVVMKNYGDGFLCGKRHNVFFKASECCHEGSCGCISGRGDVILWMSAEKEDFIPNSDQVTFKCKIYLYQAKMEPGLNTTSLYDTFVDVFFSGCHAKSMVRHQSLVPTWNEMISFENVSLKGDAESFVRNPPVILFKLHDKERRGQEFLGIGYTVPKVSLKTSPKSRDSLKWIPIHRNGILVGQLLIQVDLQETPEEDEEERIQYSTPMPKEVDILMQKFHLIFTCFGLRLMDRIVRKSSQISLELGNVTLSMGSCSRIWGRSCNFTDPVKFAEIFLPENLSYWPPIVLKHRRDSAKIIGITVISNTPRFFEKRHILVNTRKNSGNFTDPKVPKVSNEIIESGGLNFLKSTFSKLLGIAPGAPEEAADIEQGIVQEIPEVSQNLTWWSKFFNSEEESENHSDTIHKLKIYHSELENQPEFNYFRDWADNFEMMKARKTMQKYCFLRGHIEIMKSDSFEAKLAKYQQVAQHTREVSIGVRVYVVKGINLRSRDASSNSDAYICIELGNVKISDRENFVKNQVNPFFGRCFDLEGKIPQDHILKISLRDRDISECSDDLIGETLIDLEDRLFTKHRASFAVAEEYNMFGYNMWRCSKTPLEILLRLCEEYNLPEPKFSENSLWIGEKEFTDLTRLSLSENLHERLALSALRQFDELIEGVFLVPEHVETRSLFRSDRPGIEQGKIQLWVEIFESHQIPPAIDISPEKPVKYELRVIVWNTADVAMKDTTILGAKMSDIYVKCWLMNLDKDTQTTDIHYRSLNGEGKFNWRMIFPFNFLESEKKVVTTKKRRFYEKFDTTLKSPPLLNIQIWDNDTVSADDFIGATAINLNHLHVPSSEVKNRSLCSRAEFNNLFMGKSIRGWFPVEGNYRRKELTGKVELELEVLTEAEALQKPVGRQRSGPEPLKDPSRPKISFQWYKSPWMTLRHILMPSILGKCPVRWCYVAGLLLVLIVLLWTL